MKEENVTLELKRGQVELLLEMFAQVLPQVQIQLISFQKKEIRSKEEENVIKFLSEEIQLLKPINDYLELKYHEFNWCTRAECDFWQRYKAREKRKEIEN